MVTSNEKIAAFGEHLLRLTPVDRGRLLNAGKLEMAFAGAETNVLSALSLWGHQTLFISKLPQGPLGENALMSLKQFGVGVSGITRGEGRMGTYFIELGNSIRPSRVVYDRTDSSISLMEKGDFDWQKLLTGASWFHLSGITLALSENCMKESITAVEVAQSMGVKVSFDMNFRRSLWNDRELARKAYDSIMHRTDLLFSNEGSLKDVYDWESSIDSGEQKDQQLMEMVLNTFGINMVAFTRRDHQSASMNKLDTTLLMESSFYQAKPYQVMVNDRFGTGDSFAAGILHGLIKSWDPERIVNFGSAAFAYKHTVSGDQLLSTEDEIISIMEGNIHGHVIR